MRLALFLVAVLVATSANAEIVLTDTLRELEVDDVALIVEEDSSFISEEVSTQSQWTTIHIFNDSNVLLSKSDGYGNSAAMVWLSNYDTSKLVVKNIFQMDFLVRYRGNATLAEVEETLSPESLDVVAFRAKLEASGRFSENEIEARSRAEIARFRLHSIDYEKLTSLRPTDTVFWFDALTDLKIELFTARNGTRNSCILKERTRRAVMMEVFNKKAMRFEEYVFAIDSFSKESARRIKAIPMATPPVRTWTDPSGVFSVDAHYVPPPTTSTQVNLVREDNEKSITVPLSKLSDDDRTWIRQYNEYLNEVPGNPQRDMAVKIARARYAAIRRQNRLAKQEAAAEAYSKNRAATISGATSRALTVRSWIP